MSPNEPSPPNSKTDDEENYIDVGLWPWQIDALFNYDRYGFVAISGGRGAGKSYLDSPFVMRLSELAKDLYFGICAPTDTMLQTVLSEVRRTVDDFGINHVYGPRAPREWREQWDADGIAYPSPRFRNDRFWIWEDGTHFFTFSIANNAFTRAKGLNMNVIYGQEFTEPGVTDDVYTTLIGCLRCGQATRQKDGTWRCVVPGHWHQIRTVFNVPLRNPSHFMYTKMRRMQAQEEARLAEGRAPYFKLIQVRTQDNKATGDSFVDMLRSAWDEQTFVEQTSGDILHASTSALTYYSFSDANILPSLGYHNDRDIHLWFDFNRTPASSGFGHDLDPRREVPPEDAAAKYHFGIVGELFSGSDPLDSYQHATALLEDPFEAPGVKESQCRSCRDNPRGVCHEKLGNHREVPGQGWLCPRCAFSTKTEYGKMYCSGKPVGFEGSRKHIHAPSNWHGLIKHKGMIYVYGDQAGGQQHSSSVAGSDWQIIRELFYAHLDDRVEFRVKASNPLISLRLLAVNAGLRSANGTHAIHVAPWCEAHIEDFRQVVPDPKNNGAPKKVQATEKERAKGNGYWLRSHASDGFGYLVDVRWPFQIPKSGDMPLSSSSEHHPILDTRWPSPNGR